MYNSNRVSCYDKKGRPTLIIDNKHYINAIKLHVNLLIVDGIYVTICWTSGDCNGQVDFKLHLSIGKVILFPYFDHWLLPCFDFLPYNNRNILVERS